MPDARQKEIRALVKKSNSQNDEEFDETLKERKLTKEEKAYAVALRSQVQIAVL